jgi:hypothetical protein
VQRARLRLRIDIGIGDGRFVRQRRRFNAATHPEVFSAVRFDPFTAGADGSDAVSMVFGAASMDAAITVPPAAAGAALMAACTAADIPPAAFRRERRPNKETRKNGAFPIALRNDEQAGSFA